MTTTGSGSVSNSAVCFFFFFSDALRTEGWQPAATVARPPERGGCEQAGPRPREQSGGQARTLHTEVIYGASLNGAGVIFLHSSFSSIFVCAALFLRIRKNHNPSNTLKCINHDLTFFLLYSCRFESCIHSIGLSLSYLKKHVNLLH